MGETLGSALKDFTRINVQPEVRKQVDYILPEQSWESKCRVKFNMIKLGRERTQRQLKVFKDKLMYAQGLCVPPPSNCTGNVQVVFSIFFSCKASVKEHQNVKVINSRRKGTHKL